MVRRPWNPFHFATYLIHAHPTKAVSWALMVTNEQNPTYPHCPAMSEFVSIETKNAHVEGDESTRYLLRDQVACIVIHSFDIPSTYYIATLSMRLSASMASFSCHFCPLLLLLFHSACRFRDLQCRKWGEGLVSFSNHCFHLFNGRTNFGSLCGKLLELLAWPIY